MSILRGPSDGRGMMTRSTVSAITLLRRPRPCTEALVLRGFLNATQVSEGYIPCTWPVCNYIKVRINTRGIRIIYIYLIYTYLCEYMGE